MHLDIVCMLRVGLVIDVMAQIFDLVNKRRPIAVFHFPKEIKFY